MAFNPDLRIVFQNDAGGVSIITPAEQSMTIEQIAAKDVPGGKPHKIVHASEIPADRAARGDWAAGLFG